ncbi:hypothetical protein ACJMK2_026418 [Sinanodonta woodiana]|uniref:ADAM10 endopeptidase n=1 Tax=Sinanodonta woodiana TaxID=1069815 RepID=A0ABD3XLE1_SINWO
MELKVCSGGSNLDDYILHYEELNYDSADLHQRHLRSKRSTDGPVHLAFDAFGRNFKLRLRRDTSVFTPSYMMREEDGTLKNVDLSFLYTGEVVDIPGSKVDGAIIQGIFRGEIHIPGDTVYHIEVNNRFNKSQLSTGHHSVIYRDQDLDLDPYRSQRERDKREASMSASRSGYCGNDQAVQWMRSVVQSEDIHDKNRHTRNTMEWQEVYDAHNHHSADHNVYTSTLHRQKRETLTMENTCTLHLKSDPLLWNHVMGKTQVMTSQSAKCDQSGESPYCRDNLDVSNFLNLHSMENHDDFCLAYVFTYRDFAQGTLGLAWVGSPSQASGGVCERFKQYAGVEKSLNTGIVTTLNYGKEVPFSVSKLTFAHEVGHNFGSPHDSGGTCAPSGDRGNYIMFPSATSGIDEFNSQFSPCSKGNISRVLDAVINKRNGKFNCFANSTAAFCGNGLVEKDEECDCGYAGDCKDQCCHGKTGDNNNGMSCKRQFNKTCSPSEGPCCTRDCNHANSTITCREEEECLDASTCVRNIMIIEILNSITGNSSVCPQPSNTTHDNKYCNNYGHICKNGECSRSLCEKFGWHECSKPGPTGSVKEKEALCILACRNTTSHECISSNDPDLKNISPEFFNMVNDVVTNRSERGDAKDGVKLPSGSPCNNFQGYCDVFHRCRGIDAEGPLSRLTNLIFNPKTLEDVRDWIIEHWWAVIPMALGLVLAMGLFVKLFAVHTPSSVPKAKPERRLSDKIRRRPNQIHEQRQYYNEKQF